MRRIYLDYAASTPIDPRVKAVINKNIGIFGNPSSLHSFGQEALKIIDDARFKTASFFGVRPDEVIFTGSATEANNLVVRGLVQSGFHGANFKVPHIISTQIEHDSVLNTLKALEPNGLAVTYLPVGRDGRVRVQDVGSFIRRETILVSVMVVNNETGAIQPIEEISRAVRTYRRINDSIFPLLHVDAVQAVQSEDCRLDHLGADLLTISGHKIYGPKGIGCVIMKRGVPFQTIITGGNQEDGLRAGTENTSAIAGLAEALTLIKDNKRSEVEYLKRIEKRFLNGLTELGIAFSVNSEAAKRVPHIINIRFPGQKSDELLINLDLSGVAVSAGSACSSRALNPSHVLTAMGMSYDDVRSSLRFSFGRFTTEKEITTTLNILKKIL